MSGNQHQPDPFSREGAQPGDGLGEPNRFDTWADGATPAGQQFPGSAPSAADPYGQPPADQPYGQPSADQPPAPQPSAPDSAGAFPAYPYGSSGSASEAYANPSANDYSNPQVDEAYAAFQGYQASTSQYPAQQVAPYQGYQPSYAVPHSPYARSLPNSTYAIPSLVLGVLSFVSCGITGPLGVGFGVAAMKQIQSEPNSYGGNGLALGGIITGALGTLFLVFWILSALVS